MATTSTEDCGKRYFRWGQKAYRKEGKPHFEWDSNQSPKSTLTSNRDAWSGRTRPCTVLQDHINEIVRGFLGTAHNTRTVANCAGLRAPVVDAYRDKLFARLRAEKLRAEFTALAAQWRNETKFLSSSDDKIMHSAYQSIIAMGAAAVPLVLEELEVRRGHWFWALHFMAKADPVLEGANIDQAREAWLKWGRENGYLK
jgi:hypothetical protein